MEQKNKIQEFTDLVSWQRAHELVLLIYKRTESFPQKEIFGITSQMRRASVSITSNIAEGFSRQSYKEKVQFYYMSLGSLTELKNQCIISRDLLYINAETYKEIDLKIISTYQLLQGLIKKSKFILINKI